MAQEDKKNIRRHSKVCKKTSHPGAQFEPAGNVCRRWERTAAVKTSPPVQQQRNRSPNPIEQGILLAAFKNDISAPVEQEISYADALKNDISAPVEKKMSYADVLKNGRSATVEKKMSYADALKRQPEPKQHKSDAGNVEPADRPETPEKKPNQPNDARNVRQKHASSIPTERTFSPQRSERSTNSCPTNQRRSAIPANAYDQDMSIRELLLIFLGDLADTTRAQSASQTKWAQHDTSCTFNGLISATCGYFMNLREKTKARKGLSRNMSRRDFLMLLIDEFTDAENSKAVHEETCMQRVATPTANELEVYSAALDFNLRYGRQNYTRWFADPLHLDPLYDTVLKLGRKLHEMNAILLGPAYSTNTREKPICPTVELQDFASVFVRVQELCLSSNIQPIACVPSDATRWIPAHQGSLLNEAATIQMLTLKLEEMGSILFGDGNCPIPDTQQHFSDSNDSLSLVEDYQSSPFDTTVFQLAMKHQEMNAFLRNDSNGSMQTPSDVDQRQNSTQDDATQQAGNPMSNIINSFISDGVNQYQSEPQYPTCLNHEYQCPPMRITKLYDLTMKLLEMNSILFVDGYGTIHTNSTHEQMPDISVPSSDPDGKKRKQL